MAIHATSADALLSYSLATSPTDPLNASTDKDPVIGRLDITVGRNMTTAAYCRKIIVKIPIGAGAAHLTTVNTNDIKQSVTGGSDPGHGNGWTATAAAEGDKRVFTFTPGRAPEFTGQWAVTLVISQIPINKVVGKPVIEVIEETSPTNGNFTPKEPVRITVDKAPPGFLFRNLRPSKIMVENGEKVTLTWEIQNGTCVMYWDDKSDPNVNSEPKWTSPALHNTTGFMLQATSAEDASFVHTLTTAVTVAKPDLDTGHLNVYGNATAHNGLVVRGDLVARDILVVEGKTYTLDELQAKGITIGTDLGKGHLDIHGNTTAHDGLSIKGAANIMDGDLIHRLTVTMKEAKTFRFSTDGMIFGNADGGHALEFTIQRSSGSCTLNIARSSNFCFPAPRDAAVVAKTVPMGGSGPYPSTTFFFVPFGSGGPI
ncbi:hypothetical protein ACFV84_00215 [Kitasatospora sp. NPDC059811]|uniref:hypothetical protein n=1 Tax=Streptomycetaceae TaxID=2062 RepID=UPI0007AEF81F|nr:hypothetical protein [Streptomyces sp. MJM8645]